ncbi:MAG: von Willebrand factor type A domain-containing protein [Myxococcales bacterium]|nr:von Willebrand factor type A domain-containing protein [Myxococcales bacterium]
MTRKYLFALVFFALAACDDGALGGAEGYDGADDSPDTERYQHHPVNAFVDASEDHLVTFAADVDTGSYTLMRSSLARGTLPPADSVRVEEYLNFFDYRDAPPADDQTPFAVHLEAAPSHFGAGLHLLRVGIKGYEVLAEERPAANLVFLVDVSGSMNDTNKLPLVRYALRRLTETLRPDDTIGMVVYAGSVGTVLAPTPVRERDTILAAIDQLRAGGSTNGEGGIRAAYALAEAAARPGSVNRVILCSDGDFNVGATGETLLALIDEYRQRDVTLSVFGFGRGNYNDRDMEQLADRGNGNYAYIDREAEAERVLVRRVTGTLLTIAKDVKIQVDLNPDLVARYRLIGYENRDIADDDFRDDAVDAGEIGAGHTVTALIEAELVDGFAESDAPLATATLRWKDPAASDRVGELSVDLRGRDVVSDFVEASRALRFGAAVAEFAEILRESPHSEGRRLAEVEALAARAAVEGDADQAELIRLVGLAAGM